MNVRDAAAGHTRVCTTGTVNTVNETMRDAAERDQRAQAAAAQLSVASSTKL